MSEWYDSEKKRSGDFRKLLQKRLDKANPRRTLTAEETTKLAKREGVPCDIYEFGKRSQRIY